MQSMIRSLDTPKGKVVLREANEADVESYRKLRLFALQESPAAFSSDYQTNREQPNSFWADRLKPDPHGITCVIEADRELVGMSGILRGNSQKTRHSAMIWGVYVRPEWRGVGVARAMIDHCCHWAVEQGVKIVKLGVMTDNEAAVRLYQRCGFMVYGTEPQAICVDGRFYDEFLMSRALPGA